MRIGVISDTHGLLRPEATARLAGVDHIIHAGDIGEPNIIILLRRIAPVTAVRGNVDTGAWAAAYPERATVTLAGHTIHVLHDLKRLGPDAAGQGFDVVVSGHTHRPLIETVDGVLYVNPGSAGSRRFDIRPSVATLDLAAAGLAPALHEISP